MIGEVRDPLPARPGSCRKVDDEYVRNGVAEIFVAIEPLGGRHFVDITERRCRTDWAHFIKRLVDEGYPSAEKIVLVMDNLNTHDVSSLYEAFEPKEAQRIREKLEIHYTPKHGSWLNVAEIEIGVLKSQCLSVRIATLAEMQKRVALWENDRNTRGATVDWQFTTENARVKLKHLYPIIKTQN